MHVFFKVLFCSFLIISYPIIFNESNMVKNSSSHSHNIMSQDDMKQIKWEKDLEAEKKVSVMNHAVKISHDASIVTKKGTFAKVDGIITGSGAVVAHVNGKTLIITADHVCGSPDGINITSVFVMKSDMYVITTGEKKVKAKILMKDAPNDVCTIMVDGYLGVPAPVSRENPPIGATVSSVGAPVGIWGKNLVVYVEGVYSGVKELSDLGKQFGGFNQYSLPGVGGASGSGVFYNGHLIGIVTHVARKYNHVTWGPQAIAVSRIIEMSIELIDTSYVREGPRGEGD